MAGRFVTYASALAVQINGYLQNEECSASVSHEVGAPLKVTMASFVPADGFEFDPSKEVGSGREYDIKVFVMTNREIPSNAFLEIKATVVGWSVGASPLKSTVTFAEVPQKESADPLTSTDPDVP